MADAVRVTIVFEVPVELGQDGWEQCSTLQDCADLTQTQYDNNEVSAYELLDWADEYKDLSLVVEPVVS